MVRRQRIIEGQRNKRLEEEKKRKAEFQKFQKKVLEAAYDDDVATLKAVYAEVQSKEVKDDGPQLDGQEKAKKPNISEKFRQLTTSRRVRALVDCTDPNGNTPLSEASAGGACNAIKYLLALEADPNSRGQFQRTPLWRASFCGHGDAAKLLLEHGADPRLCADDSQNPADVAPNFELKSIFEHWNILHTDHMLKAISAAQERHKKEAEDLNKARCDQIDDQIADAERQVQLRSQKNCQCHEAYNRRYKFVDKTPPSHPQYAMAKQALNDAELEMESAKIELEKARGYLANLRLRRRELTAKEKTDGKKKKEEIRVNFRELDDVIMRDVGNVLQKSKKWPILIDPSGQSATFLRYRDCNYIHALHPNEMKAESIRLALLGAVRFGKPFVLDLMDQDSLLDTSVRVRFDEIQKGLLDDLINKRKFLDEEVYFDLIRSYDGLDYQRNAFNPTLSAGFMFFVLTSCHIPNHDVVQHFLPVKVVTEISEMLDHSHDDSGGGWA